MNEQAGKWGFLTNHARVLLVIARDPAIRLRDIAAACHITERTVLSIVTDLERGGYLRREREGRRTRYVLRRDGTLRRPAEANVSVGELLELFTPRDSER
ncbi:helix-turn-helix domain-containing protein [Streptomyces sp. NPDC046237]|uniref:MarR family transcriptional regulator n=1 Tax=Streptomyces sp. NPDC046237 TaxID=3154914 RepID=UPI0033F4FE04